MAQGIGFSIDASFLNKIEQADKALKKLADTNDTVVKNISNTWKQIGEQGLDSYLRSLEKQKNVLADIASIKFDDSAPYYLKKFGENARSSVAEIDKLIQTLTTLQQATPKQQAIEKARQEAYDIVARADAKTGGKDWSLTGEVALREYQAQLEAMRRYVAERKAMYAQMFDEIDAKERKQQTDYSNYRQQQLNDELAQYRKNKEAQAAIDRRNYEERRKQLQETFDAETKAFNEASIAAKSLHTSMVSLFDQINKAQAAMRSDNLMKNNTDYWNHTTMLMFDHYNKQRQSEQDMANIRQRNIEEYAKTYAKLLQERDKNALNSFFANSNNPQSASEKAMMYLQSTEQNRQIKQNIEDVTRAFNERAKVWEEGFRRAEEKEKQLARDIFNRIQRTGDTSNQATAAYNRLFSGKGNVSLNNMQSVLSKLQDAQRKLNLDTDAGKQKYEQLAAMIKRVQQRINEATGASNQLRNSHNSLINTGDQLMRKFALIFSVSQIQGYINKLVQVRGEFELQQRALQAILQNKEEADKLWQQTVDLAVRSPFRVGELVKYTKQLAAYRIETDKLHDTTKRLADVSAGLGVDMSRLILAFGQVRAASYLRGTELRQFTEAGIPMLEELAKYFTELEGKAVSVGDVFGRISKRMVAFSDVEEVFKRMTDAGGTFYNMQEIQAETLKGQISNLHDSIDLMLNDIGKANEGVLKGGVQVAKSFVENWEKIYIVLKQVATSITVISFAKFIAGFKASGLALNLFLKRANGAALAGAKLKSTFLNMGSWLKTHPWIALAGVIASVSWALYDLYQQSQKTRRELEKLEIQGAFDAQMSVTEFKRLADSVRDTSKSYKEQKQALDTLQRKYKDIVPDKLLEIKNIKDAKDGYDEATNAIRAYIAEKTKEKQIQLIESEEGKKVSDAMDVLSKSLRKQLSKALGGADVTAQQVQPIIDKFKEGIESGEIYFSNYISKLREIIKLHTSLDIEVSNLTYGTYGGLKTLNVLGDEARVFYVALKSMNKAIDEISGKSIDFGSFMPIKEVEDISNKYNEQLNVFKDLLAVIRKYQDEVKLINKGELKIENRLISKEQYDETLAQLNKLFKDVGLEAPKWNKIINDTFRLNKETIAYNTALWQQQIKDISELDIAENLFGARENYVEKIEKQINDFNGDKFTKEINRIVIELADKFKVTTEGLESLFYDSSKGLDEYVNNVRTIIKGLFQTMTQHEASVKNKNLLSPISNEQYELLKEQKPLLEAFLKILESFGKQPKKGKGKDWWLEMVKGVQSLHKEFNTLRKNLDFTDAKLLAIEKHKTLFAEIKKNLGAKASFIDIEKIDFADEKALENFLAQLKDVKGISAEARLAIEKALTDIKGEATIEVQVEETDAVERAISDMFGNYEMSLELEKLNIPPDLAKQLFGIESVDLSELRNKILDKAGLSSLQGKTNEEIYSSEAFNLLSEERQKAVKDGLEKEEELERKAQEDRLKKYVKYLQKAQDARVKIKLEELRQIDEVEKENSFTEGQKEDIKKALQRETKKAIDKQTWEDFTGSAFYIEIFRDLENTSTEAIKVMRERLLALKDLLGDQSPEQLKAMVEQLEKMDDELTKRQNPFKQLSGNLKEYFEYLKKSKQLNEEFIDSQDKIRRLELNRDSLSNEVAVAEQRWKAEVKISGVNSDQSRLLQQEYIIQKSLLNQTLQRLVAEGKISEELARQIREGQTAGNKAGQNIQTIGSYFNEFGSGVTEIAGNLENVFGSMSDSMRDTVESIAEIANGVGNTVSGIGRVVANPADIGGYIQALGGLTSTIGAIFNTRDKSLERQIQNNIKMVEQLERAYQRLEKRIEDAYSVGNIQTNYELAKKNLIQQQEAYANMIEMEEAKKKTDKDKIREWKNELEDLRQQERELEEQRLADLGGFGSQANYKSAAEEFANAWFDAYQEVGDGMGALEDTFDDFINNVVKKQLLIKGSNKLLQPVLDMIDKAVSDGEVTTQEMAEVNRKWNEDTKDALNSYYKSIYDMYDGLISGAGELSDLQRGIQNITEPQAAAIEAYLNSLRFFVSDSNRVLKEIQQQMSVGVNNPMVSELKAQTQLIRTIDENLSSVIGRGSSSHTGAYIKVLAK